jgi:hypothetical protein
MPAPVATLQVANPGLGTVSRQPQTTGAPGGGQTSAPFVRLSRRAQIPGALSSGNAFGALINPTLKPVGGYLRGLILYVTASGGVNGAGTVAAAADAPYSALQSILLRDPFGQPVYQADGYSAFLIMLYGGQSGALGFGNTPATLPSFSAVAVGSGGGGTGAFTFRMEIPLEFDSSGYCSLPSMNAASQPQIQMNLAASAAVYTTPPSTTVPTVSVSVDEPFWASPVDNPGYAPPDVGSSAQWSVAQAAQPVSASSYQRIQLPRVGTYLHTLILVLRDSTSARIESWPVSDVQLWIDGVPVLMETLNERQDVMFRQFGVSRPTGVLCYSWRDSVQQFASSADTHDLMIPTTPATLLEVAGTFGAIANAPAKITVITGELYPVQGIPYGHLAE